MRQKSGPRGTSSEKLVKDIRRATRKRYSAEARIRIVLDGLRGEETIAELCRREGIAQCLSEATTHMVDADQSKYFHEVIAFEGVVGRVAVDNFGLPSWVVGERARIEDFQMWKNVVASVLFCLGMIFPGALGVEAMQLSGDPRLPKSVPTLHAASYFATCILNGKLTSGVAFHESDWWHDRLSDVTFDYSPSPTNPPVGFFSFNIARSGPFAPGDQIVLFSTQNSSTVAATRVTVTITADDLASGDATFQRNCVTTKDKRGEAASRHERIVQQGAGEFHAWCSRCHGSMGRGNGPFAKNLKKKPLDLTELAARNNGEFPIDLVRSLVDGRGMPRAHGTPEMPIWGAWFAEQMTSGGLEKKDETELQKLIKQRIDRIASYLETIQDP